MKQWHTFQFHKVDPLNYNEKEDGLNKGKNQCFKLKKYNVEWNWAFIVDIPPKDCGYVIHFAFSHLLALRTPSKVLILDYS